MTTFAAFAHLLSHPWAQLWCTSRDTQYWSTAL